MFLLKQWIGGTSGMFEEGSLWKKCGHLLLLSQGINIVQDWKLATQPTCGFKNKILDPQIFLLLFKNTIYLEHSKYIFTNQKFNSFHKDLNVVDLTQLKAEDRNLTMTLAILQEHRVQWEVFEEQRRDPYLGRREEQSWAEKHSEKMWNWSPGGWVGSYSSSTFV